MHVYCQSDLGLRSCFLLCRRAVTHSFQQVKTSLSAFPYSDRGAQGRGEDDLQESEFPVDVSDVSPVFLSSDTFHSLS